MLVLLVVLSVALLAWLWHLGGKDHTWTGGE